ncbi:MAG TPA: hypothetical protein VMJ10_19940 [Kofleriaceae bacterium]|nr:hypothetical protein [Kofleriaceae bacterium]
MSKWWPRIRYALALAALCAIATCPAAKRACTAQQRAKEADQLLSYLGDRVAAAVAATGKVPPLPAGPTPEPSCCDQGGTCSQDAALWDTPGWRALAFTIDGDFRYVYEYVPDPSGASAVIRARADLDCDGHPSRIELHVLATGSAVERTWVREE